MRKDYVMVDNNNKKANFLVSILFPDNTDVTTDINTELIIQKELAHTMHKLVEQGVISHFTVADDDIISDKLKQTTFTGHYDCNGKPIYVGNTIREGCNGLVAKVEYNTERGAYWLEGLGEGYGIENSETEWEILD